MIKSDDEAYQLWSSRRGHEVNIREFSCRKDGKDKYCGVLYQLPMETQHTVIIKHSNTALQTQQGGGTLCTFGWGCAAGSLYQTTSGCIL